MTIILLSFVAALILSILAYRAYLRADAPIYFGCSVYDLPDHQPVIRQSNGQFAKGSQPIAPRGAGGKFVKTA